MNMSEDTHLIIAEIQKMRADLERESSESHRRLYDKIESVRDDLRVRIDALEEKTNTDINDIKIECHARKEPLQRAVAHLSTPHINNDVWLNNKLGNWCLLLLGSIVVGYFMRLLDAYFAGGK